MFKKLLIGLAFILSVPVFADSPKLWFQNEGGFSRDTLSNGTVTVESGMFGGYNLESLVSNNPRALEFAKKHSIYNTYTHISLWSSLAVYCGLAIVSAGTGNISYLYGGFGGLIGGIILAGYFQSESKHYLYHAINTYNGVNVPQPVTQELRMQFLSFNF